MPSSPLFFIPFTLLAVTGADPHVFSSPMVHRFSDEARRAAVVVPAREVGPWPDLRSPEYYEVLVRSDRLRQRQRLGGAKYSMLYPAEGSQTLAPGNDFGWLHYTWVDLGTPNVSFLVALDAGSDLFWVPCDCIQCAPLSGYHGSLDKELGLYNPHSSKTSKQISCSHELCTLGGICKSSKQPCPYTVNYYSENTSTSGLLVEDTMHLAKTDDHISIQATVIIGCGRKQSGGYLDGIAPDGLLGLGFGEISVPSMLSRAGLVRNSFSMCFRGDDSGRIFFGDQGVSTQHTTPFVALDGKFITYIIGVENFCVGTRCLGKTSFQALVDTGSSFTYLPEEIYRKVTMEFDRQISASRFDYEDYPWEYCYTANSLEAAQVPAITLTFSVNESFKVANPIFSIYDKEGHELAGFCIALQSAAESIGTIGQNFMTGYHMVFDRENLQLGWSRSDCHNPESSTRVLLSPPPPPSRRESRLPSNPQQRSPNGREVTPAIAGRAPIIPSAASSQELIWFFPSFRYCLSFLLYLVV